MIFLKCGNVQISKKIFCTDKLSLAISFEYIYSAKKGPPDLFVACLATKKLLLRQIILHKATVLFTDYFTDYFY